MSVNVSPRQLEAPKFADHVGDVLQRVSINPRCLILEITEAAVVDASRDALATLAALQRLGVRVALDDFGTGYSSLGSLRRLPVDILKVDRSLVSGSPTDEQDDALVEAIIALGQRLDLEVISEGIETRDQLARLRDRGCRSGQGFLFCRPVPPAAVDALLAAATCVPSDGSDDSKERAASSTPA